MINKMSAGFSTQSGRLLFVNACAKGETALWKIIFWKCGILQKSFLE